MAGFKKPHDQFISKQLS